MPHKVVGNFFRTKSFCIPFLTDSRDFSIPYFPSLQQYMKRNHRSVPRTAKPSNRNFSDSFYAKRATENANNEENNGMDDEMFAAASEANDDDRSGFNGDFGGDVEMTDQGR